MLAVGQFSAQPPTAITSQQTFILSENESPTLKL